MSGGFDIVIGNPPYVRHEKIKYIKPFLQKHYRVFVSTADLYVYFYEKGYRLLKEDGVLAYITSNKWMRTRYGERLRKFLKENTTILKLMDFTGYRVFEVTVDTCIILFRKNEPLKRSAFGFLIVGSDVSDLEKYLKGVGWQGMFQERLSDNVWTLGDDRLFSLRQHIEKVGKPLREWDVDIFRGITTGCNEVFIIDNEARNKILASCRDEEERRRTEEIIKPILRGRDVKRWRYKWAGLWVIGTYRGIDIEKYPSVKLYLSQFKERLEKRSGGVKWYELQGGIYNTKGRFEEEKVVWQEIVRESSFAYDTSGMYIDVTALLMTGKNLKYLIGVLNSTPATFFFRTFYAGGGLGEDGFRYQKVFLEQLPVPPITNENRYFTDQIARKVDEILMLTQAFDYETNQEKQQKVKELEREIDELVYKLYGLTEEEIMLIESKDYYGRIDRNGELF